MQYVSCYRNPFVRCILMTTLCLLVEAEASMGADRPGSLPSQEPPLVLSDTTLLTEAEADEGQLSGSAWISEAGGFTYFSMDIGWIQWDFDLPTSGVFDLTVLTHLRGNYQRGQRVLVNGTNLRNNPVYPDYFWSVADGYPSNEWFTTLITQADLIEGADALNFSSGSNTIRIEASWGYQRFANIRLVNAVGDTVVALDPVDATASPLVNPVCEGSDWCPTGFKSVALGNGGLITWNIGLSDGDGYLVKVFHHAPSGGTGSLRVDGAPVSTLDFSGGIDYLYSDVFVLPAAKSSASTLEILNTGTDTVMIDAIQVLSVTPFPSPCESQLQIPTSECNALVALYDSTSGAGWTTNTGWNSTATPCSWFGVTCSGGNVSEINLESNNLDGPIPPSLDDLTQLKKLILWTNHLTGTIPESLGSLTHLERLGLDANELTGSIPESLGSLSNLIVLQLIANNLSGPIPETFGNLANLQQLFLHNNNLSGTIPSSIGQLTHLRGLSLSSNHLSGKIPESLGNLDSLEYLELSINDLEGTIPASLHNLTSLWALRLRNNHLQGTVPLPVAAIGSPMGLNCSLIFNAGLCVPDIPAYQSYATGGMICGLPLDSACTPVIHADIKVFLEGAYVASNGMSVTDEFASSRPLTAPSASMADAGARGKIADDATVNQFPDGSIDWVTLSLRTDVSPETTVPASNRAAILREDGMIVDTSGSTLGFHGVEPGAYYVVVRHRNHLTVMSSDTLDLSDGFGSWNFASGSDQAHTTGPPPMKDMGDGYFGMFAADANADGQITTADFNLWLPDTKAALKGYHPTDFNLDGQITAADFNLWLANTKAGAASQVPN